MTFSVKRDNSTTLETHTFTNPTAAALTTYFDDHAFDFGALPITSSPNLNFILDLTTSTVGASFNMDLLFGNATANAAPQVGD